MGKKTGKSRCRFKDRETLSTDGVVIMAIGLDSKNQKVVNGPDVQTRGFIYMKDADYITGILPRS